MSDPIRMRDEASGAAPATRALLGAAARPMPMSPDDLARTAARVAQVPVLAATRVWPWWLKALGVAVVTGPMALGVAVVVATHRSPAPAARAAAATLWTAAPPADPTRLGPAPMQPVVPMAPATATRAAAPTTHAVTTLPMAPVLARTTPVATAAESPAAAEQPASAGSSALGSGGAPGGTNAVAEDELAREQRLLDPAQAALAANRSAEAIELLGPHAAAFPSGQLASEREYMRIVALQHLGREDELRERSAAFLQQFASSPQAARVRRMARDPR